MSERILVVDDEPDIRDLLRLTLEGDGYEVYEAADGEEALLMVQRASPHLVLMDFKMPRLNGGQVCQVLKKDILLQQLPVILLTSKGEVVDKVQGLDAGADDYVVKPFDPMELLARVRMVLRRTARALDANPLSKLPGNVSILEELQRRLDLGSPTAICYIDLDKFKTFNDTYGFKRGDEAIKATARILLATMRERGNPDDFLGHIGGDDFVLLTTPDRANAICERIVTRFAQAAPEFYEEVDRKRGFIEAKDRDGVVKQFPLLTVSIAVVTNEQRPLKHVAEVAQIGAELKEWVKSKGGNRFVTDRRIEQ